MNEREYRPNSHKYREEQQRAEEKKRVGKVVTGNVKTRKNEMRKLTDVFIAEDAKDVKHYVLMDVLVPAIKNTILDIIIDSATMIFKGDTGRSRKRSTSDYVSYSRSYDRDRREERHEPKRRGFDYEDIEFETRGDAYAVLQGMRETIDEYDLVRVGDLYDMVERTPPFTSYSYGWSNLDNVDVVKVRGGGYILKLPRAMPID